ncbi:MAG: helix-turn-helix domain-containing protein [Thermocrinis sp.]|jgi:transcriptional regulator with XRE-family HTH domain|uniref:helix-turn-helix domain-containing protein n=1 Tax=Thermocrinis sp. TaxID=2024383 RepID=UPI003C104BAA
MGNNPTIKEIVREKCREIGLSLAKLAFKLEVNQIYLLNVLHGRKVSRPLIKRLAETLHLSDLPSQYEMFLSQRCVENKVTKPTSSKKGRKKSKNPIKEVYHEALKL